jgi:hypothetical protein
MQTLQTDFTFTIVPDEVTLSFMSGDAKLVYLLIASHTNKNRKTAWPGRERLMKLAGFKKYRLDKAVKELEKAGWLEVDRTPGKPNHYTVHQTSPITRLHQSNHQTGTSPITRPELEQVNNNKEQQQTAAAEPLFECGVVEEEDIPDDGIFAYRDIEEDSFEAVFSKLKEACPGITQNKTVDQICYSLPEKTGHWKDYIDHTAAEVQEKDGKFSALFITALKQDWYLDEFQGREEKKYCSDCGMTLRPDGTCELCSSRLRCEECGEVLEERFIVMREKVSSNNQHLVCPNTRCQQSPAYKSDEELAQEWGVFRKQLALNG